MKAKFGDDLLSKTFTAQVNEALAKVVAQNVCLQIRVHCESDTAYGQEVA